MDQETTIENTSPKGRSSATVGTRPGSSAANPCTLVIFGADGDLTKRLLMPALYNLASSKLLSPDFSVLGVDRGQSTTESWKGSLDHTLRSFTTDPTSESYTPELDEAAWGWLSQRLSHIQGDFTKDDTFAEISKAIENSSAIFYLAVPSRFFAVIIEGLGRSGLLRQNDGKFRNVIIEKPFGSDLASAEALNACILKHGDESQYYRIDHFLGKETVQSIMALRFANGMFEPTWRREYIDHVQITASETVGVEGRGSFYEGTGALRDMVPNHLFTLLCMVAMEPPNSFDADDVRSEKAKLLSAIQPLDPNQAVRAQYEAGTSLGHDVAAYRQEPDVAADSRTETYVALKLLIDNWRWAGVPFYIRTGKHMAGRKTEISIHHRPAPYNMFRDTPVNQLTPNVVRLLIDPEQGVVTQFDAKVPGPEMRLGKVQSALHYKDFFQEKPAVGYETLLYDCMMGDATLFQRADAIEASWRAVQPILDAWSGNQAELHRYAAGSQGPEAADALLARDGRSWLPVGDEAGSQQKASK